MAALLLLAAVVATPVVDPAPAEAGPTTGIASWETATIALPNGGIGYDAVRDRVLVAVSPSVVGLGNHLVELDPHTGALGRSVAIGADPTTMAVADDSSRAYVGGSGSSYVDEVDLASFTVTRRIHLGSNPQYGALFPEDIAVQPGHPSVIAVSRQVPSNSPRNKGVAVFDAGVKRPVETPEHTGPNQITWDDDPTRILGTSYELWVVDVSPDGVRQTNAGQVTGEHVGIERGGGQIVTTDGDVIDGRTAALDGRYTAHGAVEVDPSNGTTYFLDGASLSSHDTTTLLPIDHRTVPSVAPTSLVGAGDVLVAAGSEAILLLGEDVSGAGFSPPPGPESRLRSADQISVAIQVGQLAASPGGTHVYGVVGQGAPDLPGRVVEISTATGEVTRSLFVGADPHRIEISHDGTTLMVGHRDANKLTEVATSDLSVRRTIPLGARRFAADIAARPGSSATFAVVLSNQCCSPWLEGQVLVRDGVVLPSSGPGHTGATSITFLDDPERLYGVDGESTGAGFYALRADADGLTPLSSVPGISTGFGIQVVGSEGLVYLSNGRIIDPVTTTVVGSLPAGGAVPVPLTDRVFVAGGSAVREFDLDTRSLVAIHPVPGATTSAVSTGNRLAVATEQGTVVIIPLEVDPPTVSALAPATGAPWGGTRVKITGDALRTARAVRFGEAPATSFEVVSDDELVAIAPAHTVGDVAVTVLTQAGTNDLGPATTFTYAWPARSPEASWVWAAYADFLGREPSRSEAEAAAARLTSGVPRATIARELAASDEWLVAIVGGFYADTLGRAPDPAGLANWVDRLRSGRSSVAQVAASFYASSEYFQGIGGGTVPTWVDDLYGKLLHRQPDAGGLRYWAGQAERRGRGPVALELYQSMESRRARVSGLYRDLLGRAPDAAGRDHWAVRLRRDGDLALARSLAASSEYQRRAAVRFP